jgi:putative iron-dependent peroxidase
MGQPQGGILPDSNCHAAFLTFKLCSGEETVERIRQAAAGLPEMTAEMAALDPAANPVSVIAFGAGVWNDLYPAARPAGLAPFRVFADDGRSAPATQADIFVHLRADRRDLVFALTRRLRLALGDAVAVVEEVHGFRNMDGRDLTGFVDGTENPRGVEDRSRVALLSDGAFAGGSFVNIQRYVHDLSSWETLSVHQQEDIIARSKEDDVEYPSERKPPTAHIKRVSIKVDGESLEILRHSMPYGTADEHGLYFVAYAARPASFSRMLEAMIVADAAGHYDHLMDYSRAVTGAAFFAPPMDWLKSG